MNNPVNYGALITNMDDADRILEASATPERVKELQTAMVLDAIYRVGQEKAEAYFANPANRRSCWTAGQFKLLQEGE